MALTLHKSPPALSFSNDPIIFGFTTDNQVVNVGTIAQATIEFTSNMSENDTLSVRWGDKEVLFKAVSTPLTANELPTGTQDEATLLPYFRDNHTINKDFVVDLNAGKIRFTAREAGTYYNLASGAFTAGSILTTVSGVNPDVRPNFGIWIEVTAGGKIVLDDIFPIEDDSTAEIDIHEAIHSILQPDLPGEMSVVDKCTNSHTTYTIRYAEVFGVQPQIQLISSMATPKHAILGSTSKKNKLTALQHLVQATAAEDPALRYGSTIRYAQTDEEQYLYYCAARAGGTGFKAKVDVTYDDDTTHSFDTSTVDLSQYEKAFFSVGHDTLNLGSLPKTVKSYNVTIYQDTNQVSKAYTFILDYQYHRYRRYFAYVNSVGGVDMFTAYGKQSREMEFFKNLAEKSIDKSFDDIAQFVDYNIEFQEQYQVATGFKSKTEIAYLRDFYLSAAKYVVKDKWYPIIVNTTKVREAKDQQNLVAQSFEYSYAWRDDGLSESDVDDDIMQSPLPPQGFLGGGDVNITNPEAPLLWDAVPTALSQRAVRSGGVYSALEAKQDVLTTGTVSQYIRGNLSLGNFANDVFAAADTRYRYNANGFYNNLYSPIFDAVDPASTDPSVTPKGRLDIGRNFANTINFGQYNKLFSIYGITQFLDGQIFLRKDATTGANYNPNANAGLTWGNSDGVITDYIKPVATGYEIQAEGKSKLNINLEDEGTTSNTKLKVYHDRLGIESTDVSRHGFEFVAPAAADFQGSMLSFTLPDVAGQIATLNTAWSLQGNSGLTGDQVLGIDHEANINVNIFGSTIATFSPDKNFGVGTVSPLAKIHAHENIIGNAEVALFRASNGNVDNFFSVAVDPTVNRINLYNSGTLRVKNGWQFDALAHFSVNPTTINATANNHIPNWGQVQNAINIGGVSGMDVFYVCTTNQDITASNWSDGQNTFSSGQALLIGQTDATENGIYENYGGGWVRPTQADESSELLGKLHYCLTGANAGKTYLNTNQSAITIGTTAITYREFGFQENDPIFQASIAAGITQGDIDSWNAYSTSKLDASVVNVSNLRVAMMQNGVLRNSPLLYETNGNSDQILSMRDAIYDVELNIEGRLLGHTIVASTTVKTPLIEPTNIRLNNNNGFQGATIRHNGNNPVWAFLSINDLSNVNTTSFPSFDDVVLAFDSNSFEWKPTQISTDYLTDWSTAWDAKMASFIGAAPQALDTWLELVAEIQDNDSAIAAINSTLAQKYNAADFSTDWTTQYNAITKGTAYNKNFGTSAGEVAEGNHTHLATDITDFEIAWGNLWNTNKPYTLAGNPALSGATATWNGYNLIARGYPFFPGEAELGLHGTSMGLKLGGLFNIIYGTSANAYLDLGSTGNQYRSVRVRASESVELFSPIYEVIEYRAEGNFKRDWYGLRLTPNDIGIIGVDENEGFMSFFLRSYNEEGDIVQHETIISPVDGHLYKLVNGQAFKYQLEGQGSSGGSVGNLQAVTNNGRESTHRLQFKSGDTLTNYALATEVAAANNIDAVLLAGNETTNKFIKFIKPYATDTSTSTGLEFALDISGNTDSRASLDLHVRSGHPWLELVNNESILINASHVLNLTGARDIVLNVGSNYRIKMFGKVRLSDVQPYASNTDALNAGLEPGDLYRTGSSIQIVT